MMKSWRDAALAIDNCKCIDICSVEKINFWGLKIIVEELVPQLYPENPDRDFSAHLAGKIQAEMIRNPQSIGRVFQITFEECISYMVVNECYGRYPEPPEVFFGKLFREFTRSMLLDVTRKMTHASNMYPGPGPLRHFSIVGQDDVVEIITCHAPSINLL